MVLQWTYTALRSNLTSLAFARLYPFDPGIRRERVRPTLERSEMVALSGAGLGIVVILPLLPATVASDLSPRSTPTRVVGFMEAWLVREAILSLTES